MLKSKAGERRAKRLIRQERVRNEVRGTDSRPRLCVYRSLKYTYAQIISDETNRVVCTASSKDLTTKSKGSVEAAKAVGQKIAEVAKKSGVENVVFDRNGFSYHGRVKAVADAAREAGLQF
ncbi:50S ribosomal protein L18 [bacterium]|nr:50S ribosomal protein L18 [bacterium]